MGLISAIKGLTFSHPFLGAITSNRAQVTQVTIERTFSGLNYIFNDLRFKMKDDMVDDIMVLRTNV